MVQGCTVKKLSTTVYFDQRDADRLKTLSARTKVPMAAFIREAIRRYLDLTEAKLEQEKGGQS